MNPEVRLLFHEVADLPPGDRERIYAERRIATELRAEVESLLEFDSADTQSFTHCVSDAAEGVRRFKAGAGLGDCGPYRLERLLDSGGMGAVYLAERTDGEIQQKVAVKLLRADGHHRDWQARFLKERQLLASLNHPSIVRVMDAGHTDDGRPYLVMEYVEGTAIDVYSREIDLRRQLELFVRVCEGVSHAHHRLIIHRDLKPSNILVDASGRPKLLDFGIAKLLDETGDPTRTTERLLTPNYASPEQLRGEVQTTATDVYSLGAVLYKLLAGRSPHESDTGESQAVQVIAGKREIPPPGSLKPVPADLDFIVGKALRTEPEERYVSVEALAADIRAFLDSRPVEARSGNAWYRARKFLRRYWAPAAAAALVIASLSAGLYIANRERIIAQRRFSQLRQLSVKVFDLDRAIRNLPGATQARQSLVSASLEYLEGLALEARGDLELAQELAEGYSRVGRVQGVPTDLNLGDSARAEASLKKADALIETVLAARPNDRRALYRSAFIAQDRMILAEREHRRDDALVLARKSAGRMEQFLKLDSREQARDDAAGLYANLALAQMNLHRYADAVPLARRSAELARSLPSGLSRLSGALSTLGSALRYQGDLEGAWQAVREAREITEKTPYQNETQRMIREYGVLLREGTILGEDGGVSLARPEDAIEPFQKAFDLMEAAARKDPQDYSSRSRLAESGRNLGNILRHRDPPRALAVYDLAIRRMREVQNNRAARRDLAVLLASSSDPLLRLRRGPEARQRLDAALEILKETKDLPAQQIPLDSEPYVVLSALANYYAEQGDPRGAIAVYQELLDKTMAAHPEPFADLFDAVRLSAIYEALARIDRRIGDAAGAEGIEARRLELWQRWDRQLPGNAFIRRQLEAARRP